MDEKIRQYISHHAQINDSEKDVLEFLYDCVIVKEQVIDDISRWRQLLFMVINFVSLDGKEIFIGFEREISIETQLKDEPLAGIKLNTICEMEQEKITSFKYVKKED